MNGWYLLAAAGVTLLAVVARRKGLLTPGNHLPIEIAYFINGRELLRETTTIDRMKKEGQLRTSFAGQLRIQGLVSTGEARYEHLRNGGSKLSIRVTYQGKPATFSMVARAVGR